jgi:signal peptidase II
MLISSLGMIPAVLMQTFVCAMPWMMAEAIISGILLVTALVVFLLRFARGRVWMLVALTVAFADQLIKYLVTNCLPGGTKVPLPGQGGIVYHENHLLGFGTSNSDLLACTLAAILVLVMLSLRLKHMNYRIGGFAELSCALLIGGCSGILIDRIRFGYVIDWLDLGPRSDFIYNLADLAVIASVTVGIVAVIRFFVKYQNAHTDKKSAIETSSDSAGVVAARATRTRFGNMSPSEIANALGVKVIHDDQPSQALADIGVRSEYRNKPPTIVLYDAPLRDLAQEIQTRDSEWFGVDLAELHIAHELFHHLENGTSASERDAHDFAANLLKLPVSPDVLDTLMRSSNG